MASSGGIIRLTQEISAAWVRCRNCERERLWRDVFWHEEYRQFFCIDVFRCEARLEAQVRAEARARA